MSQQARVQALFQEPACDKNQAKDATARKKGCSKPLTPGAAAGGCAFDGAKIVLQPVTDVAHLIHGPLACEGNSWDNRGAASSGPGLWRMSFTTDLTELDVVMGQGEKKLFKAIREIVEAHAPPAVFVYSTCVTALIGDDLDAVCFRASERFGTPVVPVHAPGLRRLEKPRQQARGRGLARPRHRLARAGRRRPDGHQYSRRVQPFRRVLDGEAAARETRHAGARLHTRATRAISTSPAPIPRAPT